MIAQDYHNRNVIAAKLANDTMPDVYAVNANYGAYLVEHGGRINTCFSLYNHDSAEELLKKELEIFFSSEMKSAKAMCTRNSDIFGNEKWVLNRRHRPRRKRIFM